MKAIVIMQKAVMVGVILAALGSQHAVASGRSQAVTPIPAVPIESSLSTFGAVWQVGGGTNTMLALRNDGRESISASVLLYANNGQLAAATKVNDISPRTTTRLALSDLFAAGENVQWGGLTVQFSGSPQSLAGQVTLQQANGSMVSYALHGGYRFDTENALAAPWWLPDAETDGNITLFNSGAQAIVVTSSFRANGAEKVAGQVVITPNSSKSLSLRTLMDKAGIQASTGAIVLHYTGAAHALQPSLLLTNAHTGFALMPEFNATHGAQVSQDTRWQFPYVPLTMKGGSPLDSAGDLATYLLLSNGTVTQMPLQIITYSVGNGEVQESSLSLPALEPQETRLVSLSELAKQLPSPSSRLALTVSHAGQPGDLGITIFGLSPNGQVLARSRGVILPVDSSQVSYWDISSGRAILHRIKGVEGTGTSAKATLLYQTEDALRSYQLPTTLAAADNPEQRINLTQILRMGVPDESGSRLPSGVASGLVVLSPANPTSSPSAIRLANNLATCATNCSVELARTPIHSLASSSVAFAKLSGPVALACPPPPSLSCSPSTVTRGGTVTCTVSDSPKATGWTFKDASGNTVTRGASTSTTWSGTIVTGGTVSVTADQAALSASISVSNRSSFAFTAVNPVQASGNSITCNDGSTHVLPSPPAPNSAEGFSCANQVFSFNFATVSDSGPNNGYEYITSASNANGSSATNYSYIVVSDVLSATTFFNAQCGTYSSSNTSGFIAGSQLKTNIFDHESGSVLSHWTEYRDAQNDSSNNIGTVLEATTAAPGSTGSSFGSNAGSSAVGRIASAVAVEPCLGLVDKDSSQSCKFCGNFNYAPYQSCGGATPVPFCQ